MTVYSSTPSHLSREVVVPSLDKGEVWTLNYKAPVEFITDNTIVTHTV